MNETNDIDTSNESQFGYTANVCRDFTYGMPLSNLDNSILSKNKEEIFH